MQLDFEQMRVRERLDSLILSSGQDYAALSRMIGRNPAYIQQFIKRGSPRDLAESDRRTLSRFFGVDERELGAPAPEGGGLRRLRTLEVGASAGHGAFGSGLAEDREAARRFAFSEDWLRSLGRDPERLTLIQVQGDSMEPLLRHGDDIMVEAARPGAPIPPGIQVVRHDGTLFVKRVDRAPDGRVTLISENEAYPPMTDLEPDSVEWIGKVVWVGRRL